MKNLHWKQAALAIGVAVLVASCGGGGAEGPGNRAGVKTLVAFGDSLSDIGSYRVGTIAGLAADTGGAGRWTVNSPTGGQIWTERIAAIMGLPAPCSAETGLLPNQSGITGEAVTAHAGCTSYAQGSARVSSPVAPFSVALQAAGKQNIGLMAKPVTAQVAAHLASHNGSFASTELVTVLAGANDIFMELQLTAPTNPTAAVTNVAAAAVTLANLIKTEMVAKGAKQVLVLNLPDIASTPFGMSEPAPVRALLDTMVQTFNAKLAEGLTGVQGVRLGNAYAENKDQFTNPAQYGLSNVTSVACGPNALSDPAGTNGTSLVCNASNAVAGDISHYFFADSVHPTPYGHELLSQFASRELSRAGWL